MDFVELVKESFRTLWQHKRLWVFGIFLAEGGGAAANARRGGGGAGAGGSEILSALPFIVGLALVLGLAALALQIISEGALIDSVSRARRGQPVLLRDGFRAGVARFGPVLGVKAALVGLALAVAAIVSLPWLARAFAGLSLGAAVLLTLPLAAVAVPALLTLTLVAEYALRISVLEGKSAGAALAEGYAFLHGRLLESLKLLIASMVARMGVAAVAVAALMPGALLAVAAYFAVGLWAAIPVGVVLVLPVALAGAGAAGAVTSSVWTLGFLQQRTEAR